MKKIIYTTFSLLFVSGILFGQEVVSYTIRALPDEPNKAKVFFRSSQNLNELALTNAIISFSIPASLNPRPSFALAGTGFYGNHSYESVEPITQSTGGNSFHTYTFFTLPNTVRTIVANTEYELATLTISSPTDATTDLRLVYFPDGGDNDLTGMRFELNGEDKTNIANMFYGTGAVNAGNTDGFSFVGTSIILPVDFRSFYALKNGEDARLTWNVENETNNSHFEVMRSLNGQQFTRIATVNALNNGRSANSYETTDFSITKLGSREVFYQIKQVDKDGTITNSQVRKLSVDGRGGAATAFPNPATSTTKVKVDASEAGQGNLILRDGMGRQVRLLNTQFHRGINLFDMNLMGLASGEYTIQVNGGGVNETIKLTKVQ